MLKAELEELVEELRGKIFDIEIEKEKLGNLIKAYELEKSDGVAWEITLARLNK